MARANPANRAQPQQENEVKQDGPKIEYFGEGAEKVEFNIDPNAVLIRVYADGRILTDY